MRHRNGDRPPLEVGTAIASLADDNNTASDGNASQESSIEQIRLVGPPETTETVQGELRGFLSLLEQWAELYVVAFAHALKAKTGRRAHSVTG
ncbi:hypothetical protein [Streptomyces sp. NPDC051662]|uniref:hypothetical protein n=1 Tax=Streptomyces sp. NPDC051662 TaxID=3154750 RepID=UPI003447DFFF